MMPIERVKFHLKPLVDSMLDQLPPHVFTSDSTTFLDPAFGGGQFLREVVTRLRAAGHSDDNIRSRIYGCEITNFRVKYATQLGKVISDNLIKADFLSHDWGDMKFDVILGNPPYQSNEATTKKLWPLFVEKASALCNTNGHVSMVTPASWLSRPEGKSNRNITKNIFAANYLQWVDTTSSKHFDVGESVAAWMLQMSPADSRLTKIITSDSSLNIHYQGQQVALNHRQQLVYDIMNIIDSHKGARLRNNVYNDVNTSISIAEHIERKIMFDRATPNRVPVFWTASNKDSYYMDRKHIRKGIKVILNVSGYYYQSDDSTKYITIDSKDAYAVGAGALGLPCATLKQAQNALSFLTSKLYQFYVNNEKTSGFNTGIIKLPLLDITKKWNDQSIYEHFGLTDEHQHLVETAYTSKVV